MEFPARLNGTAGIGGAAWTAGTYTTLTSYPGEWAILQGTAGYDAVVGWVTASSGTGSERRAWKLERLGITQGPYSGIGINGGPFWIRYCHIYNNGKNAANYDENLSGINIRRSSYNIIEYNYFYSNGDTASNNPGHIVNYADYLYSSGTFGLDIANRNNIVRYNYFAGTAKNGIHDKAAQYLADYDEVNPTDQHGPGKITDFTNREHGNKYHHNIFEDCRGDAIYSSQFFQQVYNNISDGAPITTHANSTERPKFGLCFYNNTVIDNSISITAGYDRVEDAFQPRFFCVNNIVTRGISTGYTASIGLAAEASFRRSPAVGACNLDDFDWAGTTVDRNLIHDPVSSTYHFSLYNSYGGTKECKNSRWITTTAFNTLRSVTNYNNSTSGLFSSGYMTDGTFVVSGSTTIADGGIGGAHPYLSSVNIPSYVGAVNPDDNAWVAGVLALDATYMMHASAGSDPLWIEGASGVLIEDPDVPGAPDNLIIFE